MNHIITFITFSSFELCAVAQHELYEHLYEHK